MRDILTRYRLKRQSASGKPDLVVSREYLIEQMATALNEQNSRRVWRLMAANIPPPVIFETLARVKDAARTGRLRSLGALFTALIK